MSDAEPSDRSIGPREGAFRRDWPVVLASFVGIGLGFSPLSIYTIGVFAPLLVAEFGWTMSQVMFGVTVQVMAILAAAPLAGLLAQRFGPRPVALVSLVLFALTFMAFGAINGSLALYYVNCVALAVVGAGTLPITFTTVINRRFDLQRGLALGVAMAGTGLFGFLVKPYAAWLIGAFGWRGAYIGIGLLPLLVAFPVALFLFHDRPATGSKEAPRPVTLAGATVGEAVREWRFWLIWVALLPISFAIGGVIPSLETILKLDGFAPGQVVELAAIVGLAAVAGRIGCGWLLDRLWAPLVALVILSLLAAAYLFLAYGTPTMLTAGVAVVLIGFSAGAEFDLVAYLASRYFGLRAYAGIYGLFYLAFGIGSGAGPLLFAMSFDATGSYAVALAASAGALVAGALALQALGRYRTWSAATPV